jgi:hypothetical protein
LDLPKDTTDQNRELNKLEQSGRLFQFEAKASGTAATFPQLFNTCQRGIIPQA